MEDNVNGVMLCEATTDQIVAEFERRELQHLLALETVKPGDGAMTPVRLFVKASSPQAAMTMLKAVGGLIRSQMQQNEGHGVDDRREEGGPMPDAGP